MKRILRVFVAILMLFASFDVRAEQIGQVVGFQFHTDKPNRVVFGDGRVVLLIGGQRLVVHSECTVEWFYEQFDWWQTNWGWQKEHYVPPTVLKIVPRTIDCVLMQSSMPSPARRCKRKESGKSIALIQPQYPHGGKKQTYLPAGVLNLGSRLVQAGAEVDFIDLNRTEFQASLEILERADVIGITVLGPPYIPEVIKTIREMRKAGLTQPILVGGQGVSLLKDESNFAKWFDGLGAVRIKDASEVASYCGVAPENIPSEYQTSLVPMLEKISQEELRAYLTTEFPLFLSQGCAFNCDFCAADKAKKEKYRTCESLEEEVRWVCKYLTSIGHTELRAYLSNLDGFQTPKELEKGLAIVKKVCESYGIVPHLRCLATSRCTFIACRKDPELPSRLRDCGLEIVAFGADGADKETWDSQNKTHNSMLELQSVADSMEKAGITVELLMVIGFQNNSMMSLYKSFVFSLRQAWRGRIIRPYLAKSQTPAGRWQKDDPLVKAMVADPTLLSRLDYAMIGSVQTHPKFFHRMVANGVYLALIGVLAPFGKCPTRPLVPVPKGFGRSIAHLINRIMPFDS